jgi:hypothetical protein
MKTFTIENETNNITVHATVAEAEAVANAERFRNEGGLAKLAADWPMAKLIDIWNSLPGVEPVRKFKDRNTGVSRIWRQIQTLGVAEPVTETVPESEAAAPGDQVSTGAPAEVAECERVLITDQISAREVPTESEALAPEAEPETVPTPSDVAAQTPDVAPETAPAKVRATRKAKAPTEPKNAAPRAESKTAQVIAMLKREGGTTLEEVMAAMQWQKHTTRAMLSAGGSLTRNHGLTVISEKVGEHRRYSIKG